MQGGDGARAERRDFDVRTPILSQAQDLFDATQVGHYAESRLAILAEGLDDAVVAVAVGLVGLEGRHN